MIKRHKRINTAFGYFGSKNKISLQIINNLPPHNCWVEAFCGSAALTLAKPPAPIEIINDIDKEIVNLFDQLRNNEKKLCRLIALTPYAREELSTARSINKRISKIERARLFLVKSMMAINGVFGEQKGGFSYSHSYSRNGKEARVNRWFNLPERLEKVAERLRNVRIENIDARLLLSKYLNRPATLFYMDPPYFVERTNGYEIDANSKEFHTELLELANKAKCMIIISGYENALYSSILSKSNGWTNKSIKTSTKDSLGRTHLRTEVIWMNSQYNKAVNNQKIPIRLSKKEKLLNKVNPERN